MKGVIESFEAVGELPMARWKIVSEPEDLEGFGFPVYLKIDSPLHKSDIGGVVKCGSFEEACDKLVAIHKKFPDNRIIVQEATEGVEMIVGVKEDEVFGRVIMVGFGGVFAEMKRDVSFRALPIARADVSQMVRELEGFGVFNSRGRRHNLEDFYSLVLKVGILGEKKKFKELDLNPVMVGEKVSLIVDARVKF